MEVSKIKKTRYKVCFVGYTYAKNSPSKTAIHFECDQRKACICESNDNRFFGYHGLLTAAYKRDINLEYASIKESAATDWVKPAQVLADRTLDMISSMSDNLWITTTTGQITANDFLQ